MDATTHTSLNARQASTRRMIALALVFGVDIPAFYFLARYYLINKWVWPLTYGRAPLHTGICLGLALAGGWIAWRVSIPANRRRMRAMLRSLLGFPASRLALALLFVPLAGWLAWTFRIGQLMGDGHTWTILADIPAIWPSEPMGRWLHFYAYCSFALAGWPPGGGLRDLAVRFPSILAGMVALVGFTLMVPRVFGRKAGWDLTLFLFFSPLVVIYMGYPETSPPAHAMLALWMLGAMIRLRERMTGPPWRLTLLLSVAAYAHGFALAAALGHAVILLHWVLVVPPRRARRFGTSILLGLAPLALLAMTFWWTHRYGTGNPPEWPDWRGNAAGGSDGRILVRWSGKPERWEYLLFSPRWWRDQINLMLCACPLLPLAPWAALHQWRRGRRWELMFLGGTFAGLVALPLVWNADLGIRNDFDLMATYGFPVQILLAGWLADRLRPSRRAPLLYAVAAANFVFWVSPQMIR